MPVQRQVESFATEIAPLQKEGKILSVNVGHEQREWTTSVKDAKQTWSMKRYLFEVCIQNFAFSLAGMIPSQREICENTFMKQFKQWA